MELYWRIYKNSRSAMSKAYVQQINISQNNTKPNNTSVGCMCGSG
jgi:hypothetical protein